MNENHFLTDFARGKIIDYCGIGLSYREITCRVISIATTANMSSGIKNAEEHEKVQPVNLYVPQDKRFR